MKPDEFTYERLFRQIEELNDALNDTNLKVSTNAFKMFLERYTSQLKKSVDEPNEILDKGVIDELKKKFEKFESTLAAEATITDIYTIPERRYNSEYLKTNQKELLNAGVYEKLPEMAKYDFISSCRCILFGEATASAFHVLRTTEEVLKHFYFKYKKTKRLKKPMWGPMTSELASKKSNRPKKVILESLDLVRVSYRNPTQHPNAIYDIESAQDLFGLCIDLINKMATELET